MLINRNIYWTEIKPFIDKPVIKVITGMRRVGKSYFLRQIIEELKLKGIAPEQILYIDKEDLKYDSIRTYQDLNSYVKKEFKDITAKRYLLIDEIQEIENWEKTISSLLKTDSADIYITGSNAHLLSSELSTLISGRFVDIQIYPLGYSEYVTFRGKDFTSDKTEFEAFLRYGGLPGLFHFEKTDEVVFQYLSSVFNTILLKDIVKRYSIRNISLLERVSAFVFDNIGNLLTANNISNYLKSQKIQTYSDTVQIYLGYFVSTFIAHKVPRYDLKGKRILSINEKYYLNDLGIRHSILGYRSADISQILENVVYLELLRRGYSVNVGVLVDKEIDFIATKQNKKIYIQVAYILGSDKTVEREFSPLLDIDDNYPKYVLSMDDNIWGNDYKGIIRLNLIDFLLKFPTDA
ncbi:MAG TPA: ATPase [Lentisphaeria bacterium]|nr:MAG: ATPase [Lentisphaerae bacterium GWF2_38_69]HBM17580.1 ATPase [Lentisphaeria bacterium]